MIRGNCQVEEGTGCDFPLRKPSLPPLFQKCELGQNKQILLVFATP